MSRHHCAMNRGVLEAAFTAEHKPWNQRAPRHWEKMHGFIHGACVFPRFQKFKTNPARSCCGKNHKGTKTQRIRAQHRPSGFSAPWLCGYMFAVQTVVLEFSRFFPHVDGQTCG